MGWDDLKLASAKTVNLWPLIEFGPPHSMVVSDSWTSYMMMTTEDSKSKCFSKQLESHVVRESKLACLAGYSK